jgi:hypothetical protein
MKRNTHQEKITKRFLLVSAEGMFPAGVKRNREGVLLTKMY